MLARSFVKVHSKKNILGIIVVKVGKSLIELYDMDSLLNGHEPVKGNFLMELSYWNTLIFEACESGKMEERFQLFCRMRKESIQPNSVTVINMLRLTVA